MKQLLTALVVSVIGLATTASAVFAHEGSIDLTSSDVSCKGVSLFQDGNYRVMGRCDGLVYPYETTYNRYVLWGKTDANVNIRITEVDRGYFSGSVASPFTQMFITAEQDSLVRRPSDKQVVSGALSQFTFDKTKTTTTTTSTTTTPATTSTNGTMTVQQGTADTATTTSGSTVGRVVGRIVTSILVIVLVIVGLVIGASLIFRNRGSVSA